MRLLIMRHGPAESHSDSGRDQDRALTDSGRELTARVARELARRSPAPLRIVASPLLRARQTAEIVATALEPERTPEIREELAPSENAGSLVTELVAEGVASVLVVGHAPDVSTLAEGLLGSHVGGFEAGMVLGLDVAGRSATRVFVLRPSELAG